MRRNRILCLAAMAALTAAAAAPLAGATFGTVVPIGGHASDIALDEGRGLLYIANFTAGEIDVMSTTNNTIHSSINVALHPGSISLSPDGSLLLATNYQNGTATPPGIDAIT